MQRGISISICNFFFHNFDALNRYLTATKLIHCTGEFLTGVVAVY